MPPKSKPVGASKPQDDRFTALLKQPRFKATKGSSNKNVVEKDSRFTDVFEDEDFGVKTMDKYQRVSKKGAKEGLSGLYETEDVTPTPTPTNSKKTKIGPKSALPAAKAVPVPSAKAVAGPTKRRMPVQAQVDSESEEEEFVTPTMGHEDDQDEDGESSTDIGTTDDEDLDAHEDLDSDEEEELPEGYTHGSLPGSYAPIIENPTRRLALYNMEWDQLKAVDLLAIFRALCPLGGKINNIAVFPSEKGKIMLERERNGDFTLWTDPKMDALANQIKENKMKKKQARVEADAAKNAKSKGGKKGQTKPAATADLSDSDEYLSDGEIDKILFGNDEEDKKVIEANRLKLQAYELQKLSYYYAIIDCDTVDTAVKLYNEADGLEYESSGCVFDLRFVPEEHKFDEKTLRDRATVVPPGHRPPVFETNVLNSTAVSCTWERDDPQRQRHLTQDFTQNDYRVDDLTAFLANESDEEGFATDVPVSETDQESEDQSDEDDSNASGADDSYITSGPRKVRSDTLGRDRIASTKVVDGKKKNVLLLKRRARNDFADILAEIKSDSKEVKAKADKKDIIKKANKELNDDNDDEGEEDGDDDAKKDDFGSDWSDEDGKEEDGEGVDSDEEADAIRRKLAAAKKAKDDAKKAKGVKKPLIMLQSAMDHSTETKHNPLKESHKTLNKSQFRDRRLEEWKDHFAAATGSKKPVAAPAPITVNQDAIQEAKKAHLKNKNSKLAEMEGSIYDDDVLDDDDFFKNTDEYFPESEFGQVDFKTSKGDKKSKAAPTAPTGDSDEDADAEVKRKLKDFKSSKGRKVPQQAMDDASDSDDNEGYNLQELVQRQKVKQVALLHKKKSAKELENELIEQSLGADSHTTQKNTQLTAKDIKHAAYVVNKQSTDKAKSKKIRLNIDAMTSSGQTPVSLAAGGPVNDTFKIDVNDSRLTDLYEDADFGMDTTSSLFHNTEGTSEILAEAQRRRAAKQSQRIEATQKRKAGAAVPGSKKKSSDVSDEVAQLISKTKAAAGDKKKR